MCRCVDSFDAYKLARVSVDRAFGEDGRVSAYALKRCNDTYAQYEQDRAECDNPGQHPHRCE